MSTNYQVGALSGALTGKVPKLKGIPPVFAQVSAKSESKVVKSGSASDEVKLVKKKKRKAESQKTTDSNSPSVKRQKVESPPKQAKTTKGEVATGGKLSKKKKERVFSLPGVANARDAQSDRTIFVGNLPAALSRNEVKGYFEKFGKVTSVRIQRRHYVDPENDNDQKTPRRANPDSASKNMAAYLVFETEQMAQDALQMNAQTIGGLHIRVDSSNPKPNHKLSVFIGNVSYAAEEEDVRKHFSVCGKITSVRLIRDNETGAKKGFGYVTFETGDAQELALKLDVPLLGRTIRVQRSLENAKTKPALARQKKQYLEQKKKKLTKEKKQELKKRSKNDSDDDIEIKSGGTEWQGQKTTVKAKFRKNSLKKKPGKTNSRIGLKQKFKNSKKRTNKK